MYLTYNQKNLGLVLLGLEIIYFPRLRKSDPKVNPHIWIGLGRHFFHHSSAAPGPSRLRFTYLILNHETQTEEALSSFIPRLRTYDERLGACVERIYAKGGPSDKCLIEIKLWGSLAVVPIFITKRGCQLAPSYSSSFLITEPPPHFRIQAKILLTLNERKIRWCLKEGGKNMISLQLL